MKETQRWTGEGLAELPLRWSAGVRRVAPGRYVAGAASAEVSYPAGGHAGCFEVEDASFWFAHRNAVLREALARHAPGGPLLDVGGGNGAVSRALLDAGYGAVLLEPGEVGARNAAARGVVVMRCTLEEAALRAGALPAAGMFDVLEHIEDAAGCLATLWGALAPGGRLYLTVPAHRWLWSRADETAGHHRRYTRASLEAALRGAGFEVERLSHFFSFLVAPIALLRALPYRLRPEHTPGAEQTRREHAPSAAARRAVEALGAVERVALRAGARLPVGSSLLAVARKPGPGGR